MLESDFFHLLVGTVNVSNKMPYVTVSTPNFSLTLINVSLTYYLYIQQNSLPWPLSWLSTVIHVSIDIVFNREDIFRLHPALFEPYNSDILTVSLHIPRKIKMFL